MCNLFKKLKKLKVPLEGGEPRRIVTKQLVQQCIEELYKFATLTDGSDDLLLAKAGRVLLEVVTAPEYPEYITTYLYSHSYFRATHNT